MGEGDTAWHAPVMLKGQGREGPTALVYAVHRHAPFADGGPVSLCVIVKVEDTIGGKLEKMGQKPHYFPISPHATLLSGSCGRDYMGKPRVPNTMLHAPLHATKERETCDAFCDSKIMWQILLSPLASLSRGKRKITHTRQPTLIPFVVVASRDARGRGGGGAHEACPGGSVCASTNEAHVSSETYCGRAGGRAAGGSASFVARLKTPGKGSKGVKIGCRVVQQMACSLLNGVCGDRAAFWDSHFTAECRGFDVL